MRIALIDNLLLPRGDLLSIDTQPHLGLISLASVLRCANHQVHLIDPKLKIKSGDVIWDRDLYRVFAKLIVDLSPDVVGFTTLGCSFIFTLKVARHVKQMLPGVRIILGGPHSTILGREILSRFDWIDLVVRHEAEPTILDVLERLHLRDFEGLPGIVWRREGDVIENSGKPTVTDLDVLPSPAYDLYPLEELKLSRLRVEAGRGCPFSCTFCSTAEFFGRSYRLKSASKLCSELDWLNARYGIAEFSLTHDLFTVNKKKVLEFCKAVADRSYTWGCSARVDCVDAELISAMRSAGCADIYYGIETGSEAMQEISRKRLDLSLLFPILDRTVASGICATISFIIGYPEETEQDQNLTLDLIGNCLGRYGDKIVTQLHMLTPEPGTHLNEQFQDVLSYDGYQTDFNSLLIEPDDLDLIRANPDIFATYYFYPSSARRERAVLAVEVLWLLMQLGSAVTVHMLQYFDNKISMLVDTIEKRLGGKIVEKCVKGKLEACILDALYSELGTNHYVSSLLRFCAKTFSLRISSVKPAGVELESPSETRTDDISEQLTLARNVRLLADCHNPHVMWNRIARKPTRKLKQTNLTIGSFLLRVPKIGAGDVEIYQIDDFSLEVLKLLERPRSLRSLRKVLSDSYSESELEGFFESIRSLERQGLVVQGTAARPN